MRWMEREGGNHSGMLAELASSLCAEILRKEEYPATSSRGRSALPLVPSVQHHDGRWRRAPGGAPGRSEETALRKWCSGQGSKNAHLEAFGNESGCSRGRRVMENGMGVKKG